MSSLPSLHPLPLPTYLNRQAEKETLKKERADTVAGTIAIHKTHNGKKKASHLGQEKKGALELNREELEKA